MSSLVVFSRRSNTQLLDQQQYGQPERGDVVDMNDNDAFDWGRMVCGPEALGWWQVIITPAPTTTLRYLLETTNGAQSDWRVWRHRVWRLDLDALSVGQIPGGVWVIPADCIVANAATKFDTALHDMAKPGRVFG
jgi:hypothetical protein